jgi:hypothetical protein
MFKFHKMILPPNGAGLYQRIQAGGNISMKFLGLFLGFVGKTHGKKRKKVQESLAGVPKQCERSTVSAILELGPDHPLGCA